MRRPSLDAVLLMLAAILIVGLGVSVVYRLSHDALPRTDYTVYLCGAGAVLRGGADMYTATDVHGWHYTMPPLFAILATPLALLPIGVGAGLWYCITIVLLIVSLRLIVRLVTPPGGTPARSTLLLSLLVCADPLLDTISRSQMGILMLASCVGALWCHRRERPLLAGLLVAFATVTKVYSGLLVLFFLQRRQWRALLGVACGFVVFGGVIPALVFGPRLAWNLWSTWFGGVVLPYARPYGEELPFMELQNHLIAKNQSIYATLSHLFGMLHSGPLGAADSWIKLVAAAASALLVGAMWFAWRRLPRQPGHFDLLFAWSLPMMFGLLLVPTAWSHYFVLLLLPVAATWAYVHHHDPDRSRTLLRRAMIAVAALFLAYTVTSIVRPAVEHQPVWLDLVMLPRSAGMMCMATLVLAFAFLRLLGRPAQQQQSTSPHGTQA